MSANERRLLLGALLTSALVGLGLGAFASAGHGIARATGAAAITLLMTSLAMSPLARLLPAVWAVACRAARRRIGIAAALVALVHACLALPSYLAPLTLGPIASLPWLRHGAIALSILLVLLVTSFPALHRPLRVRAWSALHRLAYVAALFAALHALAVPFGSVRLGIAALLFTFVSLVARPLTLVLTKRAISRPD